MATLIREQCQLWMVAEVAGALWIGQIRSLPEGECFCGYQGVCGGPLVCQASLGCGIISWQCMQKLWQAAQNETGRKLTARIQGPFGGRDPPPAEMDSAQQMLVFVGGLGATAVVAALKRLALHRKGQPRRAGV